MKNRTPVPRDQRPPLPDFAPVPRRYRHDGWTPERQKAFIEALADTGAVSRAAPEDMVEPGPRPLIQPEDQHRSSDAEPSWEMLDDEEELARIEEAVAAVKAAKSTEAKTNDGDADALA